MKESEIKGLANMIKLDEDVIQKMESTIPGMREGMIKRQLRGMLLLKKMDINCRKGLKDLIEKTSDCS